ncbi:hypothetical protein RvY_02217-2 [Ramazzottius varieornatus]|uniref:Rab-GAP TBC domain-containing protein n=1 Tax=Ramazzottius varieornatus TaxID=947166 RepID=A0A1D1UJS7_RAMVA|nr:hypothetical protein RvY_02217-2 [Ramazzottius varieornatus]
MLQFALIQDRRSTGDFFGWIESRIGYLILRRRGKFDQFKAGDSGCSRMKNMSIRSLCGSRADFNQRYHTKDELQDVGRGIGERDLVEEDELGGEYMPVPGGPFSAMIPSLWPQKILQTISESPEGVTYNEFGFVRSATDPDREPFDDKAHQKLPWLAHLEFSVADQTKDNKMSWDKMHHKVAHTEKLRSMILDGIPHSLRAQMWMRLSGAVEKKYGSEIAYGDIVRSSIKIHRADDKIIERDILRIFPSHPCFSNRSSTGTNRLRRVLRSLVWMYPNIGYCPGYCSIVAPLLLFLEENDAFWLMTVIIETLLPPSYFAHGMLGAQADQKVLLELIEEYMPEVAAKFKKEDIDMTLVTISWFMSLFSNVLNISSLLPLWDWFFYDGSIVLLQTTLGMMKEKSEDMLQLESAVLFNYLSSLPNSIPSMAATLKMGASLSTNLTPEVIHQKRQKHLAVMMASTGSLFAPNFPFNMPNQEVSQGSTGSMFRGLLADHSVSSKQKNIRQTELLVNLREAILIICRHFQTHDLQLGKVVRHTFSRLSGIDTFMAKYRRMSVRFFRLVVYLRYLSSIHHHPYRTQWPITRRKVICVTAKFTDLPHAVIVAEPKPSWISSGQLTTNWASARTTSS